MSDVATDRRSRLDGRAMITLNHVAEKPFCRFYRTGNQDVVDLLEDGFVEFKSSPDGKRGWLITDLGVAWILNNQDLLTEILWRRR